MFEHVAKVSISRNCFIFSFSLSNLIWVMIGFVQARYPGFDHGILESDNTFGHLFAFTGELDYKQSENNGHEWK